MPEAARQDYHKVVEQAHEKFSETVRLAMLSLLGFALFCLLITLSMPDSALLVADPTIEMPFADVQVSPQSFLILAPLLLIVVTLYLHIFYGYWLDLETDYQHLTRQRGSRDPSIERLPTLFSLDHPVPRLFTAFIFYWLVPLVLLVMAWKAAGIVEWGVPFILFTGLVTVVLVFLQIRRCLGSRRRWNRPLWGVLVLLVGGMVIITLQFRAYLHGVGPVGILPWFSRPLNIVRADLKGQWLPRANLVNASARFANFEDAHLHRAILSRARLEGANFNNTDLQRAVIGRARLQGAKLQGAKLQEAILIDAELHGADLQGAKLQDTDLRGANFRGAGLRGADLQGADLRGVNFEGANLRDTNLQKVLGLTKDTIQAAQINEHTVLPAYLKRPAPSPSRLTE